MLCEECGLKEATIHLTKVVGDQKTEQHLCADCARNKSELNLVINSHISMANMLSGMLGQTQKLADKSDDVCEVCGSSYADFARNGRLGCSACYQRHHSRLDAVLRRIHGATEHAGKVPQRRVPEVSRLKRVGSLRRRLEDAIKTEAYEEAACLRDAIRELESAGNARGENVGGE